MAACARAFCERIEQAGYDTLVYGNKRDIARFGGDVPDGRPVWFAEYDVAVPTGQFDFVMWQYTSTGTVAGITPRGVFVELDNTVEGFVPAAQLCKGEPQVIDGVSMLDPLTGKSWMLGSSMKIRVAAADVALGRIDFEYMVE